MNATSADNAYFSFHVLNNRWMQVVTRSCAQTQSWVVTTAAQGALLRNIWNGVHSQVRSEEAVACTWYPIRSWVKACANCHSNDPQHRDRSTNSPGSSRRVNAEFSRYSNKSLICHLQVLTFPKKKLNGRRRRKWCWNKWKKKEREELIRVRRVASTMFFGRRGLVE